MEVADGKIISIHYIVTDDEGIVADSNLNFEPLDYLQGAGDILPALEHVLEGAVEDEVRNITLMPDQTYGYYDQRLTTTVYNTEIHDTTIALKAGMIMTLDNGSEAVIIEVLPDKIIVDANHPFAGKRLHFNITIKGIRPATGQEQLAGLAQATENVCGADCSCR